MPDPTLSPRRNALIELFVVIAMSLGSGMFLASAAGYFGRGGGLPAWTAALTFVFLLATSIFMARRVLSRIPDPV